MTARRKASYQWRLRKVMADRGMFTTTELVPRLAELSPDAVFVNVTNPVDVITYHIHKVSGFDWRKVYFTRLR